MSPRVQLAVQPSRLRSRSDRSERFIQIGIISMSAFAILLVLAAVVATREVVRSLSAVAFDDATGLVAVQNLRIAAEVKGRRAKAFVLTGNEQLLQGVNVANEQFTRRLRKVQESRVNQENVELVERIDLANRDYEAALDRLIAIRRDPSRTREQASSLFELEVHPAREDLDRAIIDLASQEERRLHEATTSARATVSGSLKVMLGLAAAGLIAAFAMGAVLTHSLSELRSQRLETARHLATVEALNLELDAFAGRVAHDLRNLINPIAMAPAILRGSTEDPEKVGALADRIQRATERSMAMLDGLLAFSRSGAPDVRPGTSVAAVIGDVVDQLTPLIGGRDVTVEQAVDDVTVACSRELLNVVVMNLVGNAIKFIGAGPSRLVRISAKSAGDVCELTVADTGPGIPEASLERIFEPFYRVPGTKAAGTGIGLATVRRIVESHGGRVTAEARPNGGTVFRVTLPVASLPTVPATAVETHDTEPRAMH